MPWNWARNARQRPEKSARRTGPKDHAAESTEDSQGSDNRAVKAKLKNRLRELEQQTALLTRAMAVLTKTSAAAAGGSEDGGGADDSRARFEEGGFVFEFYCEH
jgi:hypothetical protein